jgi:hypothetical protein
MKTQNGAFVESVESSENGQIEEEEYEPTQ